MVLEEIPTAEQTAVQHKHERKGSNGLIKHERRRSVSIENPEAEIAKGKVSRRKSVDASNAAEQQQQQHTAPTSPASTSTSTSPTPTAEKKSKRRYSIQEETEGDVADVETEKSERRNSAGSSSGSRRKNSIQEEDDKSERRGRRRSIQEEGSFEEKTERRSRRRDSIQEESQDPEEKDKADRKGRRGSIKEDGKEKEKEKKKVERRRSLKPEELIKAPVKEIKEEQEEEEEPVFKTLAERKAALQAHVVKSAVVPKSSPAIVERELEIEETQRVKLTEKLRIQREEEIAREDFQLMIELYIRILFELEIQGTWQELTEKGVVNQPWDEIEGKLYQDPKLNSIADNNNDEWTELKIRIFEMRHTLSELYEIFLTSFSLQVYADVFSLVEVLMTDEVQARCKQSWYQRRYTAWAQANVEVPLIFLMDLPEIAAIAEVMFDAMDYNTRQKFVDIVFDNSNGTVRSVIEKNLQKRRASAVNKFMGEISQISHRAVGFVVNTANAMQKVLKKDEKEPTKATLTVPEKGRKFSRPMSRDEIAQFMYGDDNEDLLGTMNENPLFRKSLSHMRLGELASSKADLPISAPSPIKQSLTQEILNNPTQIESLNQFTAVDQLFVELQSSVVDFLAHPELQGPEFEPMRKRVQSNLEELKKYQIEPAPMPEIIIDVESLSGDDFDEEFEQPLQGKPNDVLDKAFSNFSQPATQVAPAKEPKTKKSKSGKHWKNMKNRVKGLLSAGNKESNGYSSEFDSNMELDKIAKGEKSGK